MIFAQILNREGNAYTLDNLLDLTDWQLVNIICRPSSAAEDKPYVAARVIEPGEVEIDPVTMFREIWKERGLSEAEINARLEKWFGAGKDS